MPSLPIQSGAELVHLLQKLGYEVVRQHGSHWRLSCQGRKSVTVPDYQTISYGLLRKILRDAELTPETFERLLD